jgi:uncharacterized repeat protein (TIGR03833 family)
LRFTPVISNEYEKSLITQDLSGLPAVRADKHSGKNFTLLKHKGYRQRIQAENMDGTERVDIRPGAEVYIVLKQDQRSGKLTRGTVRDILTKSGTHPHGIKVRLQSGEVGRVKEIINV